MKSAKKAQKKASPPSLLPLPPAVAEHHGQLLRPLAEQWRSQDRVPPVLLLTGLAGVGKRELAYHLAQWLLCERAGFRTRAMDSNGDEDTSADLFGGSLFGESSAPDPASVPTMSSPAATLADPCNECQACIKAIQGSWVDFREIGGPASVATDAGEDAEESADSDTEFARLKIDDFRELKASMGFGSHEGGYRVFLIANAERLTPQAANSLLKLLEEPPPSWVLILTATDSSTLLPTLVSRCQRLRLRPFAETTLSRLLSEAKIPQERQELCLQLSQGSWKRAVELADDRIWERRNEVLRFLDNPPEHLNLLLDWASASADSLTLLVTLFEPLVLDLLKRSLAGRETTKYFALREPDPVRQSGFWLARAERLAQARSEVRLPLNKKLLAQEILLPYLMT